MQTVLRLSFACLALSLLVQPAAADVLTVRNGDRLTGKVVRLKDGMLQFKTSYAGELKVAVQDIAGLTTEKPVTLRYGSGGYSTGRLTRSYGGTLQIEGIRGGRGGTVRIAEIAEIHPGTEIPRGFRWTGRINVGATQRSGNTDTRNLHIDGAARGRSEKDRIRFEVSFNKEFDKDERIQDDFTLFAQHDRFISKKIYFYTNAKLARNEPQDLTLRTTVGTGGGWQIIESEKTNLSLEAGPSYVNENFRCADDRDFLAGRWAVNLDRHLWERFTQFFHSHEGTVDLENTGNIFIDSSTGFRFPLSNALNLTAQADVDWDSEPEPGVSSTDKTYLLTVGYSW